MNPQATLWDDGDHPIRRYTYPREIEDVVLTRPYLSARVTDPDTSAAAAIAQSGLMERLILDAFRFGDQHLTHDELCAHPLLRCYHPPTVKTACSRVVKAGLLVDSGERRPSNRGRAQVVWRLAE